MTRSGSRTGQGAAARDRAVLTSAPEGGYTALDPATGTVSEGETVEEAKRNLREAVTLYREEFPIRPPA